MKLIIAITSLLALLLNAILVQASVPSVTQAASINTQFGISAQAPNPATGITNTQNIQKPLVVNEPAATQEGRVVVMAIKGQISKKVLASIRGSIGNVQGDPVPAGLIVLLDSPGGDGIAAMKIGEILRANKAHVFVTGQCASACIFVLASGVVRGAPAYTVGIHRGRITKSDENAKILEEIDVKTNPQARELLERFEKAVPVYFAQMGMPPDLFQAMQSHQFKGVYRLSNEEITFYGLTGFESKYLDDRATLYEKCRDLITWIGMSCIVVP